MVVIMKALISFYNIKPSTIDKTEHAKDLCVFENDVLSNKKNNCTFSNHNINQGSRWSHTWGVGAQ